MWGLRSHVMSTACQPVQASEQMELLKVRAWRALYFWGHYICYFTYLCFVFLLMLDMPHDDRLLSIVAMAVYWIKWVQGELRVLMSQPSTQKMHTASAIISFKRVHTHTHRHTLRLQCCHCDICARRLVSDTLSKNSLLVHTPQESFTLLCVIGKGLHFRAHFCLSSTEATFTLVHFHFRMPF